MNNADLEMAEMAEAANALFRARKAGRCTHGSLQDRVCRDCGRRFPTDSAWFAAIDAAAEGVCSDCYGDADTFDGICSGCHAWPRHETAQPLALFAEPDPLGTLDLFDAS